MDGDHAGVSVSAAGDVNGDGIADVIIGAHSNDAGGSSAGAAYVVFGTTAAVTSVDLTAIAAGTGGFKIIGEAGSVAGRSVGGGDINGDGFADLLVGARSAGTYPNVTGAAYVVFGSAAPAASVDVTTMSLAEGFQITGEAHSDFAGVSVSSAGDVNGDGIADLIVGASKNDAGGLDAGAAYVVFGTTAAATSINLATLSGAAGFKITGEAAGDLAGVPVSAAGDVNGDGIADLIIGAYKNDAGGVDAGAAYVVFGRDVPGGDPAFTSINLATLSPSDGFKITGEANNDFAGYAVSSAGDVNGDGIADLLIGAYDNDAGGYNAGAAYVVFGTTAPVAPVDLSAIAAGTGGFKIIGEAAFPYAVDSVSSAGDINGDGFDDILIGTYYDGSFSAGYYAAAYVVFGGANPVATVDLSTVAAGTGGFRVTSEKAYDPATLKVSAAGDTNGDGFDDFIIGGNSFSYGANDYVGAAWVVFGGNFAGSGDSDTLANIENVTGSAFDDVITGDANANVLSGLGGNDTLDGGLGDDTLQGGAGDDTYVASTGNDVVISGGGNDTLEFGPDFDFEFESAVIDLATGDLTITGEVFDDALQTLVDATTTVQDHLTSPLGFVRFDDDDDGLLDTFRVANTFDVSGSAEDTVIAGSNDANGEAIVGGFGNDVLLGNAGDDTLDGGLGDDTLQGGAGDDTYVASAGNDVVISGGGNDTLEFGPDFDFEFESAVIDLATGDLTITGEVFDDALQTLVDATTTVQDHLTSPLGFVRFDDDDDGLLDTFRVANTFDVSGSAEDTVIAGSNDANGEAIVGGFGNDVLLGNAGDDTLDGGLGDDLLSGGTGNDTLDGGDGIDEVDYFDSATGVTVDLGNATASDGLGGTDTILNIEDVHGSDFDDVITGDGNANVLEGEFGNDVLDGGGGDDKVFGDEGDDVLTGGFGNDVLGAGAGDDVLTGGLGNDVLDGGAGTDTASYAAAASSVTVDLAAGTATGEGSDTLSNIESASGSDFDDALTGDGGGNALAGAGGNDVLTGAAGNDALEGGAGDDVLAGGGGNDALDGGDGVDTASYTDAAGAVTVSLDTSAAQNVGGGEGTDTLVNIEGVAGSGFGDTLTGGSGDDTLRGLGGDDVLSGGAGNDVIEGRAGNDQIEGGAGTDTADFSTAGSAVTVDLSAGTATGEKSAAGDPGTIQLSSLDGATGFTINGVDASDRLGWSVSDAGDINGDGFGDVIVGTLDGQEAFVVFGKAGGFDPSLDVSALDGSNGFTLTGPTNRFGQPVSSAGDVNGDGFDDLIIGFDRGSPFDATTGFVTYAGQSFVVFGHAGTFAPNLAVAGLDGNDGFVINGINPSDSIGSSVSAAGDVNGDGIDDVIIGAPNVDPGGVSNKGASYVVFGSSGGFAASLELSDLDGTNGFVLNGVSGWDYAGVSVSGAGDVNGDGVADIVIGARNAAPGDTFTTGTGDSYVVFGKNVAIDGVFAPSIDLVSLDGTNGFVLEGIDVGDNAGYSVSAAGDLNGDGIGDLIIGAHGADLGGVTYAGESYVVFGTAAGFAASLDLSALDGSDGFVVQGSGIYDSSGFSVSAAGDFNGDGFADLIIGTNARDGEGSTLIGGASYVVFGAAGGFTASLDLATLDGTNGLVLRGIVLEDYSGRSVSGAGDVNGDGFDDIIIGAKGGDPNAVNSAGESYVVFGFATVLSSGTDTLSNIENVTGSAFGDTLIGDAGANVLSGLGGNDTLDGGLGDDTLQGGAGDDVYVASAGNDTVQTGGGNDTLEFGPGFDFEFDSAVIDLASGDLTIAGQVFDDALQTLVDATITIQDHLTSPLAFVRFDDDDDGVLDTFRVASTFDVSGSTENTVIAGSNDANGEALVGGFGNDVLLGNAGNDTLDGGLGDDLLSGGAGNDTLEGGAGIDEVDYFDSATAINVDLSIGTATDDGLGGTDTLVNIEEVHGSDFDDVIAGDSNANTLEGESGNDTLDGKLGDDKLFGSEGDDTLTGGAGNDFIDGGSGADVAVFTGNLADYTISDTGSGVLVSGTDGTDTVSGVETLQFDDATIGVGVGSGEFQVNTFTAGDQFRTATTGLAGGGFVVTWESKNQTGPNEFEIFAQIYGADGKPVGGEFQASDARGFVDEAPAVVGLPDGGFVVAYQSTKAGSGILAQRFDAGGTLVGTEFEAATNTSQGQSVPAAGQLADGGFILTWASNHLGAGSVREIYAQRFDSDANPVTRDGQTVGNDEFFVSAGDPFNFDGRVPSVTGLEGGGFVIALQDAGQLDGNGQGIFASVFDAAGTLVGGSEFVVNTTTGLNQSRPSVTALEGGGFVVTWDDDSGADGSALGVFGRIFDAAGNALGGEFQLNTFTAGNQATPSVVALGDGGFVAVWNSADQDGDTTGVFGQRFDGAGNPVGSEFQINTETPAPRTHRRQRPSRTAALSSPGSRSARTETPTASSPSASTPRPSPSARPCSPAAPATTPSISAPTRLASPSIWTAAPATR